MTTGTVPGEVSRSLRRLLAGRSLADRRGTPVESVDPDEAMLAGPDASQVTGRLEAVLTDPVLVEESGAEPDERRRALDALLRTTRGAAERLDADPEAPLTAVEAMALEAVVRSDGSRPSLLVRGGDADATHPTVGVWAGDLASSREALRPAIAAVGRVEPVNPSARNFFGTCWVVDAGAGLALTNRHVVDAVWRRLPFRFQRMPDRALRITDGVFVDFAAEAGSTVRHRFRVVEARRPDPANPGSEGLDAAVLRLEPEPDGGDLPAAIPVVADPDGPAGVLLSFCAVGFPGPPPFVGGLHDGIDWTWVNTTLFGNRYGVKRLAPGEAHVPLGEVEGAPTVFGHDLTTLGGSSGSPLLAWRDPEPAGFGLHFAGATGLVNHAHAVSACTDALRALGVPVREPGG